MGRLDEDMDVNEMPSNPRHGEPGHDCPLEHWFEYRLQGIDIARIADALDSMNEAYKAVVMGEALQGQTPPNELRHLIAEGEALEALLERINKPLDNEYKGQRAEWVKYKEFHL